MHVVVECYKEKENNTIKQILYNNKYDISLLHKFTPVENKTRPDRKNTLKTKWAKFTYIGKETKFITKISRILTSKPLSEHKII